MVEVVGSRDTGNSPKNKLVEEIAVTLESGAFLTETFPSDMTLEAPNGQRIEGEGPITQHIAATTKPVKIEVQHAISHGKVGAASGISHLPDGSKKRFCYVIDFTNTKANKVALVRSYV
ncbi:MAG: hypothetical protein AAFY84_17190 [Pseudomonadota bacterium]